MLGEVVAHPDRDGEEEVLHDGEDERHYAGEGVTCLSIVWWCQLVDCRESHDEVLVELVGRPHEDLWREPEFWVEGHAESRFESETPTLLVAQAEASTHTHSERQSGTILEVRGKAHEQAHVRCGHDPGVGLDRLGIALARERGCREEGAQGNDQDEGAGHWSS